MALSVCVDNVTTWQPAEDATKVSVLINGRLIEDGSPVQILEEDILLADFVDDPGPTMGGGVYDFVDALP